MSKVIEPIAGLRRLLVAACVYLTAFVSQRRHLRHYRQVIDSNIHTTDDAKVTPKLWSDLKLMTHIALPRLNSKEGIGTLLFVVLFFVRSLLRVASSNHDGDVLDALQVTGADRGAAIRKALIAFAAVEMLFASACGAIEHIRHWLITSYRARLTEYFHGRLFDKLLFYQTNVLDERIEKAELFITSFCAEFAEHFAELPYYFVLPLVEAAAALITIVRRHGKGSAMFMVGVVSLSLVGMRRFTPRFGKIHATILKREEDFQRMHTEVAMFSEQIAMQRGGDFTRNRLNEQFDKLRVALNQMSLAKGHFELLEQSLESLWALGAYVVTVISSQADRLGPNTALSSIVVELRLVNNFNKFMRDFVVNFKELSHLSEFTTSLAEFERTLDHIVAGHFLRTRPRASISMETIDSVDDTSPVEQTRSFSELAMISPSAAVLAEARSSDSLDIGEKGEQEGYSMVRFADVDISNPKNILLVTHLNLVFRSNQNWAIVGDNARGKTSILRLIAGLWGPTRGTVRLDSDTCFFFLPQQAYLISGATLAEQVCFPLKPTYAEQAPSPLTPTSSSSQPHFRRPKLVIDDVELLRDALVAATALSVVESLGGWGAGRIGFEEHHCDRTCDWSTLSGGEKQKIAAARLFFHASIAARQNRQSVALLDESTSQMDAESEPRLYENLLARNIRLVSVTHRPGLLQYHTHALHLGHTPDTWRLEVLKS
jgi:ABC-type uncharacterized transport system fused permease/ATPase subunit